MIVERYKEYARVILADEKEIWRDIITTKENYTGLYQVSSYGRVKCLAHTVKGINLKGVNYTKHFPEHILTPKPNKCGYLYVCLSKNGISEIIPIHKVMSYVFFNGLSKHYYATNHIDGNKSNNHLSNLEICSQSYNIKHASKTGLRENFYKYINSKRKPVIQYDLNGNFLKEWSSGCEVQRVLGIDRRSIRDCCNNKLKKTGGFIFRFKTPA